MTALRRRLAPGHARRLIRDAGPPTAWVVIAFVVGGVLAIAVGVVRGVGLAEASRGIRPADVRARALVWYSVQEPLAPVVVGIVLVIGFIAGWW